jgi:hypothetical protein
MITQQIGQILLGELEKAVTAETIQDLVPEDLEIEAHNTLWRASDPNQLTLLKLIPTTTATSIIHQFDQVVSYGERRGDGFFGETTLPLGTKPQFARKQTNIRLIGEWSETYLLAHLQKTIRVEGSTSADAIAKQLLVLNLLEKKNRAIYFADTSTQRLGADGMKWKGLLQLIREGTDGTSGTSPYGSHVIDMEGQPLTLETLRAKAAKIITLFGRINCLIMDPFARAYFESTMDAAQRLNLPIIARAFMLGQNIGGFHTQNGDILFHTDYSLTPLAYQGQYKAEAMDQAPTSPPAVTLTLNSSPTGSNVSKWIAGDAGEFFWIVTEIKNGRESLGRRVPSSGTQAVGVGQEIQLAITPTDPLSDSFKIYRSVSSDDADTEAFGIFEVANSGSGGAVTTYDLNQARPNTSVAFGLNIRSEASEFLHQVPNGVRSQYSLAVENSERFLGMDDNPMNTVSLAQLGPSMGTMELATILPTTSRPLIYSAAAPQCRNPLQNIVFINIGSPASTG